MYVVSRFIDNKWELFGLYTNKDTAEKIKKETERVWGIPAQMIPNRIIYAVDCD